MARRDPEERVALPLDPEVALKALFAVDPDECEHDFVPTSKGGGHGVGSQPLHQSGEAFPHTHLTC